MPLDSDISWTRNELCTFISGSSFSSAEIVLAPNHRPCLKFRGRSFFPLPPDTLA